MPLLKIARLGLGLLLALMGVLFFIPESNLSIARPHPEHAAMLQGGSEAISPTIFTLGYIFGLLTLTVMGLLTLQGFRKRGTTGRPGRWIFGGVLGFMLVWTGLAVSYQIRDTGNPSFFAGFPIPTAWMLYGIILFPWVFVIIYIRFFDRWFYTPEDAAQFEALVAQNRAEQDRDA